MSGTGQRELLTLRHQVELLTRENEQYRRQLQVLLQLIVVLRAGTDFKCRARLVQEHRRLGIAWLCRVLGVERRRFYRWRSEEPVGRGVADEQLATTIARIYAESGGAYGATRVTMALRRDGLVVNRKRVARIMRERGVQSVTRRRRRALTRPDGKAPPAPDLLRREFTALRPGTRLVGDSTCLPTREGWVHLAVLLDLCTREIVGWATAARQGAALAITALPPTVGGGGRRLRRRGRDGATGETGRVQRTGF